MKRVIIIAVLLSGLFIGAAEGAPTFQAAGTAVSGTASVTPAWPVHAVGDVALLFIESEGDQPATLSTAAGFAAIANSPQFTGKDTRITVFWARATSTTMATPTVADPGDHVYAQIITYRGVISSGDPWDVTGGGVKATASTSVLVTGVTTTVADTLIVQAVARDNDSAAAAFSAQANANLTGIAERSDAGTSLGSGGGFAVWDGIKATASATGNTTATVTNSRNAFLTIALKPLLPPTVAKSFSPASIGTGGASTLTVTLTNVNATEITGTAFTDTYPANITNTGTPGLTNTCGGTTTAAANGASLALSGGTIPANGSCTVTVLVTSSVAGSYLNSTGSVTTTNAGIGTAATATLEVIHVSLSKTAMPAEALPLSEIAYTAVFQNTGNVAANMTSITDTLPDGFTYKTGSTTGLTSENPTVTGRNLIWSGTWTIPAGGSQTLSFKTFAANLRGTYTNQVSASGTNFGPYASGNTAPVKVIAPAISLNKLNDKTNAAPGEIITYSLDYINQGDAPASTVIFLDKIPENTTYVPASAAGTGVGIQYSHDGGSTWDNVDAAPVTDIKWTLTAPLQPNAGGSVSIKVLVK